MLVAAFPEYDIETIDIARLLKSDYRFLIHNLYETYLMYGMDLLERYKTFREAFWGTRFLFSYVKGLLAKNYGANPYAFTFQLQSLLDASLPGKAHFVYTDHTVLENMQYPNFNRRKIYSPDWIKLEKSIYANAAHVFTRSTNVSASLQKDYNFPVEKVSCVYAGANVQVFPSMPHLDRYAQKEILFVGVDWERKGGPILVEAFKQLLLKHPGAKLTIVGCSPKVLVPNCEVVGTVPVRELHQYYQRASIFCMPTRWEPFGAVFVEALSYHLPIVTTNIGATGDFVLSEENGYRLPVDDIETFVTALDSLLSNPQKCQSFGIAGYTLAQDRYNWDSVGQRIRQTILPLLQ